MNMMPTNSPVKLKQAENMALMHSQGMDYRSIAEETGASIATISRRMNTDRAKKIIEKASRFQVALLPKANHKLSKLLNKDDDPKIQLDAIKLVHKNTGITPSHTQSIFIANIYNDNRGSITPDVERLFGLLSGSASCASDESIDAEFEAIIDT